MTMDAFRYDGKRVLVTGGASGMGDATAGLLLDLGAEVHVLDVNKPLRAVAGFVETDLRDPSAIEESVASLGGPIHALFACAGMPQTFPALDVMLCNFCGARHLIEQVLPLMPEGGAIASIASVAGMRWPENLPAVTELVTTPGFTEAREWCEAHPEEVGDGYSFSKMAVIVYAKRKAPDLARRGVRINTISPGSTDTPMMPAFIEAAGQAAIDSVKAVAGRFSQPVEQAYPLVFLNSDGASYINGTDLVVDGGFSAALTTGLLATIAR